MSARSQLLKGILEGCILAVIKEESIYGYELSKKLQAAGLSEISEGTIYPVLLRLQKNKWIIGKMAPSPSGPSRKYYELTEEGEQALQMIIDEWNQLSAPITKILNRGS
ncbi:PadR family transcriptional regulator [Bacillus mangrovi]|uniref:PadR family transcriptional regulator n=1 Tax=Metabacillus mangrovi TaxID=1491830 RepID=A0A7X2V5D7_9BACI|nr:PadR family transcriptional regulator [Metabacillus mangrovi]MTH53938.1 PadR family transcriptional regulator [Metabacillus mangrovi]